MSTSENNGTPPLTRRQLREIRNTGATPIIPVPSDEPPTEAPAAAPEQAVEVASENAADTEDAPAPTEIVDAPPAQNAAPEPAVPGFVSPLADEGSAYAPTGLTRRQVRAQEKIRTAAVPVISPDLVPATPRSSGETPSDAAPAIFRPAVAEEPEAVAPASQPVVSSTVNPDLGSDLLSGTTPDVSLPPSFDQLIARSGAATGSVSTPNALILSETPVGGPLVAPVTATGEVMITGTFELPQGLGSVGHAPGTTDGREADAVLLDGELPAASSPTPIAASAAISTVKQPGDIIRPPAPEKGSKLVIGLIITTGALAIAVAVALAIAVTTGVFG